MFRLNITLSAIIFFVSCLWIRIGSESKTVKNTSQNRLDIDLNYSDNISTTITSIYFYFTTLATVGYGDIFPTSVSERLLIIVLQFFGIGLFSYVLSRIMYNVHNYATSYENKFNERREKLKDWIQKRDLARNNNEKDFKPGSKIENYFLFEWRFNFNDMLVNEFSKKMTTGTEFQVKNHE